MKITRSNYESWFLDYLEGNPDFRITGEFQTFINQNPDLAEELEMGNMIKLLPDHKIQFEAKEQLKKSSANQTEEFQERAVAYHEGDLSVAERLNFEVLLSENPYLAAEAKKFEKLKLTADKAVVYENKDLLKRRVTIFPSWIKAAAAAAVLVIAYLLFQSHPEVQPVPGIQVAVLKNQALPEKNKTDAKVKLEEKKPAELNRVLNPKKAKEVVPFKKKVTPTQGKGGKNAESMPKLRVPEPVPVFLKPRGICFGQPGEMELAVINLNKPTQVSGELQLSQLLAVQLAAMRDSNDREFLPTEHLGLSGLQLFAKLTGKRLTARKGDDGTVKSVGYTSHLLAFSIPVNR